MGKNLNKVLQKITAELTDEGQLAYSSSSLESVKGIFFLNLWYFPFHDASELTGPAW